MEYVTLPGTELRVSRVCLGTWQFAGSVEAGTSDVTFGSTTQENAQAIISAALEAGINFFDCAEMYGGGQAEKTLGAALEALGARDKVVLASKFGVHKPLWETDDPYGEAKAYDGDAVRAALEASLARLRTDRIDLYQVHWPSCMGWVDESMRDEWVRGTGKSVVAALEAAKAEGKIRAYGVCNMGTMDLAAWRESGGSLATNQLPYNLLWRCIERAIVPASAPAQVLAYSPLQQGLLSGKVTSAATLDEGRRRTRLFRGSHLGGAKLCMHGGSGHEDALDGPTGVLATLKATAEKASLTVAELSIQWLLSRPGVACVVVGASSPAQVRQNAAAAAAACDAATLEAATAATEGIKAAMEAEGNVVDQYAAKTRIHGS